ncbi:MAG: hypothetical protein ABI325_10940 [Ginsengibacter sp.]
MNYIFKGSLCGYLCDDCTEPLYGMEVCLYLPWQKEKVLENAIANTKETFHVVTKDEAAQRKDLLIATAKTDENGNFEFSLDEKHGNTAFDVDFICGTVPRTPPKPPRKEPVQIHLTTIFPQWRTNKEQDSYFFKWEYCIPARWWCYIRGYYFDAWVVCGHMYVCDSKTPIPNVKITAWDADFLTDDNLGNDTTDANGHFRIDYSSIDFKKTFLSPWINVETDPGTLTFNSGPDVYFKYEYNGVAIQGETSANRRNNVGYCLCVDLCLSHIEIIPDPIPASFTKIGNNGNHFINEFIASGNPNVIALATGKTPAGDAFYSCIKLRGNLSQKLNGVAMEYSFDTIETTGPAGTEIGIWKKVLAPQMCDAVIGTFFTLTGDPMNPVIIVDYTVGAGTGVDASGWIAVPQASNFAPNINGVLLGFETSSLNSNTVNMAGLIQGQSTTTIAPLQQNRFFKIRMRKRQIGNPATEATAGVSNPIAMFNTLYNNVPQFGSWMPQVSNEMGVACIDIQEMIGGGGSTGCKPIIDELHVNYTAANPNMGVVSLILYGPGGPYSIENVTPSSSVAETFDTAKELHNPALVPVKTLSKCAYTVIMSVELKLTNGESQHSNIEDWLSFCKS